MSLLDETKVAITQMGQRLRQKRLQRDESQHHFAARLGVSRITLQRMENGDPAITMKHWATALELLDRTSDLDQLFKEDEDLSAKYAEKPEKRRASRPKRKVNPA